MYKNDTTIAIPASATDEAWKKMPPFFGDDNQGRNRWTWRFDTPEKHQRMMKNYYCMASEVDRSVGTVINLSYAGFTLVLSSFIHLNIALGE